MFLGGVDSTVPYLAYEGCKLGKSAVEYEEHFPQKQSLGVLWVGLSAALLLADVWVGLQHGEQRQLQEVGQGLPLSEKKCSGN